MDSRVAFKILGNGLAADVLDNKILQSIIVEFEFAEIGGEDQQAVGRQQSGGFAQQFHMIPLCVSC